jgi:hypothetical protein
VVENFGRSNLKFHLFYVGLFCQLGADAEESQLSRARWIDLISRELYLYREGATQANG